MHIVRDPKFRVGDLVLDMHYSEHGAATPDGDEVDGPIWVGRDGGHTEFFVTTGQLRDHYEPVNLAAYDELEEAGLDDLVPDGLPERRDP